MRRFFNMVKIKPFRGLRPTPNHVQQVASPPYDVLNSEEARRMAQTNPNSFLHVVKPEIDLPPETDQYSDAVYRKAADNLSRIRKDEILRQDDSDCYYLYQMQMGNHVQTGLVAVASVDDYLENRIKKHEFTRLAKEDDRTKHILTSMAQTGPVFCIYRNDPELADVLDLILKAEPEVNFTADDGIRHSLWVVSDKNTIDKITSAFAGLELRGIGPAVSSGRIADIAVDPTDHSRWFVAAASGGVWRTMNAGATWTPVFDGEGSYSIGCVAIDPSNPGIVWVGTGENNSQRSVSFGDGVYRSLDGGDTWENMGLENSEHIGMIAVDPRDGDVVYVAAQGPLWNAGGDRGLYKTTDGGKTWAKVLEISENTGVNEVHFDPRDPDRLYATSYQRRRRTWTLIDGGPESAIYLSTDAGETWRKVENGLPSVDLGRIGLAVSPADPDVVYAIVEAAGDEGGFFRSTDRGESWTKRCDHVSGSPQYYNEIVADPVDVDRVYSLETWMHVTTDGGATFSKIGSKFRHVDDHAMWIDPDDPRHLLVGCDGGVYESRDRAETYTFKANLPVMQFYRVGIDNAEPFYFVYGGTQDNATLGGPSRTRSPAGIANEDWFVTVFGDGFQTRVDPEDPMIVYSQWQYGGLVRHDRRSGEIVNIKPVEPPGEEPWRWNWDAPLIISPHSHTRLYFAASRLFRSDDRGNSWTVVSPVLHRGIDRDALEVMGKIWGPDAVAKSESTSTYGNAVALSESPLVEGLLYVGTDDGLIWVSSDGGQNWRTEKTFPGVPDMTYVARLEASIHDPDTVFAAFDESAFYRIQHRRAWSEIKRDIIREKTKSGLIDHLPCPPILDMLMCYACRV